MTNWQVSDFGGGVNFACRVYVHVQMYSYIYVWTDGQRLAR